MKSLRYILTFGMLISLLALPVLAFAEDPAPKISGFALGQTEKSAKRACKALRYSWNPAGTTEELSACERRMADNEVVVSKSGPSRIVMGFDEGNKIQSIRFLFFSKAAYEKYSSKLKASLGKTCQESSLDGKQKSTHSFSCEKFLVFLSARHYDESYTIQFFNFTNF